MGRSGTINDAVILINCCCSRNCCEGDNSSGEEGTTWVPLPLLLPLVPALLLLLSISEEAAAAVFPLFGLPGVLLAGVVAVGTPQ